MTSLIGKRNSSSSLSAANAALRGKSYESAIALYVRALQATPELAHLCQANLRRARQRLQQHKEGAQRRRVLVCGWNLAQNPAGRVATLAEIYKGFAETEVIGCFFPEKGSQLWAPLKGFALPIHSITVSDEHNFVAQALDLVVQHPCDVLHLSKPRFPNILIGLLYKAIWGSRVIMDIDDEELAFVQASEAIEPKSWMDSNTNSLPPMANLTGREWTQISVGLADAFDAVTVANQALQKRYGGIVVPHARDEMLFKPSTQRRLKAREALKLSPEQKVVMFVGTPREHKGLLETAQALASLKRSDVTFLIAGDFPKKLEPLKRQIQSLQGLSTRFLGDQSFKSIPDLWAAGDICVLLQDPQSQAAQFQTPAKLTDALAMGLTVIAEPTPALAEFEKAGAFESVTQKTLAATLTECLARSVSSPEQHSFFTQHLTIGAVRPVLQKLLVGSTKAESYPSLQQLANALSLGFLLPPTTPATVRPAKSSPPSPVKIEKIRLPALPAEPADYVQRAAEAMAIDDWSGAYECWKALFERLGDRLSVEQLLRISRELFNLDAFTDAATVLSKAASMAPNSPGVLCEQAAQYYYHCYSSWLMLVTENEPDWYKADGLDVRPDWETACALIEKAEKVAPRNNLRRYVQAYLLLAEEAWDQKDEKSAHEALSIALTAIGPRKIDKNLTADIFKAVNQFRKGEVDDSDPYFDWLQKKIKALPINLLSVKDWLCLNDVLNWNGLLLCGYVAREKAVDLSLAQGKANPNNKELLKTAFKAGLDRNDTVQADEFLNKLKQLRADALDVRELDSCCELMKGNLEAFRQKWPHPPTPAEQRLREYLKGKTVAVVGPAPTGSLDGEEIDSHDVVIRMNWRGQAPTESSAAEFGSKTDVSLYNAHTARLLSMQGCCDSIRNLSFSLIRRFRYDKLLHLFVNSRLNRLHEFNLAFYKSFNAIQLILCNLLLAEVKSIHIFKINFYIEADKHFHGYRSDVDIKINHSKKNQAMQSVMANHDLCSQIKITNTLITNKSVQMRGNLCFDLSDSIIYISRLASAS